MMSTDDEKQIWEDIKSSSLFLPRGKIHSVQEQLFVSKGPKAKIGDVCVVGENKVLCEIISIEKENNFLLPFEQGEKVMSGEWVEVVSQKVTIPQTQYLQGMVLNANGDLMNMEDIFSKQQVSLDSKPIHAFERQEITDTFETGIRAIDGMLTIGIGQKIGIFAGSGVGKSTLLGMIAKNAKADINVIGLVGERGREVKDFIRRDLGEEGLKKSILVVATSDESHLMQLRAAKLATSIAELFRDKGKNVLLMMDSITRFADARRSVDIATDDYPVDGKTLLMESYMKRLLERSGKTKNGSITGIYTVLVDGDDMNGPIPDLARGILDGHIVLKRDLAVSGHYPAIAITESLSRVMEEVVSKEHHRISARVRELMNLYEQNETYFRLGTIKRTEENEKVFIAKEKITEINSILKQERTDFFNLEETLGQLTSIIE